MREGSGRWAGCAAAECTLAGSMRRGGVRRARYSQGVQKRNAPASPMGKQARCAVTLRNWSGRRDSNSRPHVPKTCALTGLRYAPTRWHSSRCTHEMSTAGDRLYRADVIIRAYGSRRRPHPPSRVGSLHPWYRPRRREARTALPAGTRDRLGKRSWGRAIGRRG